MRNDHPSFMLRCHDCGMPLAEGPLLGIRIDGKDESVCQSCADKRIAAVPICDFCLDADPRWLYQGNGITMSHAEEQPDGSYIFRADIEMGDEWAACDACVVLIEDFNIPAMVNRLLAVNRLSSPDLPPLIASSMGETMRVVLTGFLEAVMTSLHHPPTERKEP